MTGSRVAAEPVDPAPAVVIAVVGNCQAMAIAAALDTLVGVKAVYFSNRNRTVDFRGGVAEFRHQDGIATAFAEWAGAGRRIVLLEQITAVGSWVDTERLGPYVERTIRFPHLEAVTFWPHVKYKPAHIERLGPTRLFRMDQAALRAITARCDIDLYAEIFDRIRQELLFESPRHPVPSLMAKLVDEILRRLPAIVPDVDRAQLVADVAERSMFGRHVAHPVAGDIPKRLNCRWARTLVYRRWAVAVQSFEDGRFAVARKAASLILSAEPDDVVFRTMIEPRALMLLAVCEGRLGARDEAERAFGQVLALEHRPEAQMLMRFGFLSAIGDEDAAIEQLRAAVATGNCQPLQRERLANRLISRGEHEEAIRLLHGVLDEGSRVTARRLLAFAEVAFAAERLKAASEGFATVRSTLLVEEAQRLSKLVESQAERLRTLVARRDDSGLLSEVLLDPDLADA